MIITPGIQPGVLTVDLTPRQGISPASPPPLGYIQPRGFDFASLGGAPPQSQPSGLYGDLSTQPPMQDAFAPDGGMLQTQQGGGGILDMLRSNPKMLAGLLGAVTGGLEADKYNDISRARANEVRGILKSQPRRFADGGSTSDDQTPDASVVGWLKSMLHNYDVNNGQFPMVNRPASTEPILQTVDPSIYQRAQENAEARRKNAAGTYADGGLAKFFNGGTPGQSDKIPAMLSDGEYVMDADTVSALGDGNNAAGASALEKMRQNVRAHKRSAPVSNIPPKAKDPMAYLKKRSAK